MISKVFLKEVPRHCHSFSSSQYKSKVYCSLTLDGGGVRGIFAGKVMADMENRTKKSISQLFNGIAGTSTGGILALSSSAPESIGSCKSRFSAKETLSLYTDHKICKKIFTPYPPRPLFVGQASESNTLLGFSYHDQGIDAYTDLQGERTSLINVSHSKDGNITVDTGLSGVRNYVHTKYTAEGLEKILKERFGQLTLSTMLNDVLITSLDINTRIPRLFTRSKAQKNKTQDHLIWKIARITSAAPTYFDPFLLDKSVLVDGGMCANNPTMCMITHAQKLGYDLKNIFCVSLGTGEYITPINNTKWGELRLVPHLFDVMCESSSQLVHQQAKSLLSKGFYHRFQPTLPREITLDSTHPKTLKELEEIGDKLVSDNRERLDRIYEKLVKFSEQK